MNEITSVQIPKEIDTGFEILAKETRTPKTFHFEKALRSYLRQFDRLKPQFFQPDVKPEPDLDKIDVTVRTKHIYQARLQKAKAAKGRNKNPDSPFFSSAPADLGYTDASLLDKIIAGDE